MKRFIYLIFLLLSTNIGANEKQASFYSEEWLKLRDFACFDDPKFSVTRKFYRLFSLAASLEMGPPGKDDGCLNNEIDYFKDVNKNIPLPLSSKLVFGKELAIQSRVNAATQMAYFYYRIYDPSKLGNPENVPLKRISSVATSTVYNGFDREIRARIEKKVQQFIETLRKSNISRETPGFHAKKLNKQINKWNTLLGSDESYEEKFHLLSHFIEYKKQYHHDLADDVGLLLITDKLKDRFGEVKMKKDAICSVNPRINRGYQWRGQGRNKCFFREHESNIRAKDVVASIYELRDRFWHERKGANMPMEINQRLKYASEEEIPSLEQKLNEYIADMLVYSPRTYQQVLSRNPEHMKHICTSFEYAFEREGDEFLRQKIGNGIEFIGPAAMWTLSAGIMPFMTKKSHFAGHKVAMKGIMGITALDLIWRGKNVVELSDEITSHENQLLGGNADKFSFAELERLKRQHFKDKKGMMIVAGYEALSLVAIGRIAKILAKGQVRKFLTKSSEVEILLSTATRHKSLMKKLSKKGIETPGQFGQYLKGLSKKEQVKFGEEMMKYHFGAGTIFTGAIALKELGDTHYFMYGFPYIPQGISAID